MRVTDISGSVGTDSQRLMLENKSRLWFALHNLSASYIYLGLQLPVSSTASLVRIAPDGYYELYTKDMPWFGPVYIIGAGAGLVFVGQEVSL